MSMICANTYKIFGFYFVVESIDVRWQGFGPQLTVRGMTVTGTVEDAHLTTVTVNGVDASLDAGRFIATGVSLAEGDNPKEFLEHTKLELFHDQVFCFTPKGDLVALPVVGQVHCLVWRWLVEAYPGIAEAEHTLH